MRKLIHRIHCAIWGIALLFFGLALCTSFVFAQETLDFTGQVMIGSYAAPYTTVLPMDYTQITGDVVLAQALNPNQTNQIVTPVVYNFGGFLASTALQSTTSAGGLGASASFLFSTQNGNITGWTVELANYPDVRSQTLVSTQNGDTYTASQLQPGCFATTTGPAQCSTYSASNTMGGIWVDPPSISMKTMALAPEINSTYAVPAL